MSIETSKPRTENPRAGASGAVRRRDLLWALAVAVTVVLCALTPLIFAPRYYFNDDTQIGAFGIWFQIGDLLRSGGIPFIDPRTWMAGNYFVEGQWGLFNPMVLAIGWFARATGDAVLFSSVVKIVFLVVAGLGAYGLARSYDAAVPWAYVAGISVPLAGFTFYMDAATWVTGLFTFSLVPWFWWMVRRMSNHGANLLPAFLVGYLVVTVGYVHGTIALIFVILVNLLDLWSRRAGREALLLFGVGAALALVALAVYLPGVLTSSVTVRGSTAIINDGFFVADLNGLMSAAVATSRPEVSAWWGPFSTVPLLYISWALPLLAFVDVRRVAPLLRPMRGLIAFLVVMILWIIGPSYAGPLRIPVRMMPYVALAVLVVFAVLLSRARVVRPTLSRAAAYVALVLVGTYGAFVQTPDWREPLLVSAASLLIIGAVYTLLWSRSWSWSGRLLEPVLVALVAAVATGSTALYQHHYMPGPPLADFQLPAETSRYEDQLSAARGDVFVVGPPTSASAPAVWAETLLANQWYLNPQSVQNVYTPIGFAAYAERFCMNNRGETCAGAVDELLRTDPETGVPMVDLMGVGTVQLVKPAFVDLAVPTPPAGWSVVEDTELTQTWVRDSDVAPAGNVSWTSPGVDVTTRAAGPDEVVLAVEDVPAGGGRLVLSRLAWPGYEVDGGSLADPLGGFLLTVDLPEDAAGTDVVVRFRPPGWSLELTSLVLALAGAGLGSVAQAVVRRRRSLPERGDEGAGGLEAGEQAALRRVGQ